MECTYAMFTIFFGTNLSVLIFIAHGLNRELFRNAKYINGFIHFPQLTHRFYHGLWNTRGQCSQFFLE